MFDGDTFVNDTDTEGKGRSKEGYRDRDRNIGSATGETCGCRRPPCVYEQPEDNHKDARS